MERSVNERLTNAFLEIRDKLARSVSGIVPPRDVEDVVQETYVRICQSKNGHNIRSPKSFMFTTARNIALNNQNRASTRLVRNFDEEESNGVSELLAVDIGPFELTSSDERFAQFCEAARRLPLQCRRAFVLKKVYGHTQLEIADIMGISQKTVETHIRTGMK